MADFKRFIIFAFVLALVCILTLLSGGVNSFSGAETLAGNFSIYTSNIEELPEGVTYIKNGAGMIVSAPKDKIFEVLKSLDSVAGVSFESWQTVEFLSKKLSAKLLFTETIESENLKSYFFEIPGAKLGVKIGGKMVNAQIVEKSGKTVVGFPIVLGSY